MIEDCFAQKISCSTRTLRTVGVSMCVYMGVCGCVCVLRGVSCFKCSLNATAACID